jgi:hypothetical protein
VVTKRNKRPTRKVKNLAAKKVSPKRAKEVKGGEIPITKDTDKSTSKLL